MGIFYQHERGNFQSYSLPKFSTTMASFYLWWSSIRTKMADDLETILLLQEDETSTIEDIIDFRREYSLHIDGHITQADIIRFKSIKMYPWLYNDLRILVKPWLEEYNDVSQMMYTIDTSICVAIDSICCFPEIIHDRHAYNRYMRMTIQSLLAKLESERIGFLKLRRKFFAAAFIQEKWRKCIADPNYVVCKKRLAYEFEEFESIKKIEVGRT